MQCSEKVMRITLLRHGKTAFELKGRVGAKDLSKTAKSYDLSGIVGQPPSKTAAIVQRSNLVVCSHLARSIESASALGFTKVNVKDPLFRETTIPHFDSGPMSLPINVWIILLRTLWIFGFSRNGESLRDTRRRAKLAASRLAELTEEHQNILLVGHGLINYFIAKELRSNGWTGPTRPGNGFWEYGIYEREAT